MALKVFDQSSIGKLKLLNFALAFALFGMIALLVSHAALAVGLYSSIEKNQIAHISKARSSANAAQLKDIQCLNNIAEDWTKRMSSMGKLVHSTDTGVPADSFISKITSQCGSKWTHVGENVSQWPGGGDLIAASNATFSAYMNSPKHKANILGDYNRVGVGAYFDGTYLWTTQLFAKCYSCSAQKAWGNDTAYPVDPTVSAAPASTGLSMMPGTSPSIWGDTVAFQANDGALWTKTFGGGSANRGLGMAGGTSPSMYGNEFAFLANNGSIYRNGTYLGLGGMGGTSPSMYGDKIAFQANTGALYVNGNNQNLGMMGGTNPSINGNTVAFQANTTALWIKPVGGKANNLGLGMSGPGTSPDIWGSTIAFRANTETLWIKPLGSPAYNTGLGIAPGTSPAIYDNKVVFQAYGLGTLWRYNISTGKAENLGLGMAPGTSPDIYGDRIVFQANTNKLWQYNLATNTGGQVNP